LTEADVRELMQAYIAARSRRQRDNGQPGPPKTNGPGADESYKLATAGRT
jgi:hypothetical protein